MDQEGPGSFPPDGRIDAERPAPPPSVEAAIIGHLAKRSDGRRVSRQGDGLARSISEEGKPGLTPAFPGRGMAERLLTPAEVAALFRVDPKTVTRWAKSGKLSFIRTLGGHRRYLESEVRILLERSRRSPG
jgi:excisionase family DNA binding protein